MAWTVESSGVPPGIYEAVFTGYEPVPENVEKGYKPGFRFNFQVASGAQSGAITSRIPNGEVPRTKNGLGKFLAEMTGIANTPGVTYDPDSLIGKSFTVVVKATDSGGTRVDTAMPK